MTDAYNPKGHGADKAVAEVAFTEVDPPEHLRSYVHKYLDLKTTAPLDAPYRFHALPDACAYIVFDQVDRRIAGVTKLRAKAEDLCLSRSFHFVNIRLMPGVWHLDQEGATYGLVDAPYDGPLPLRAVNDDLAGLNFDDQQPILSGLIETLVDQGLIIANPVTARIFRNLEDIHTVADMADAVALSPRQLQRRLKQDTGFSPHDFLKVLRLQKALSGDPTANYADQSHFIHSFRNATGLTPGKHARKYDV